MLSFISDYPGKHERRGILPFLRYDALRYVFFLLFLLLIVLLTGCSAPGAGASDADQDTRGSDTLTVLCVDFPEYDWTRILVGTAAEASPGGAAGQAAEANTAKATDQGTDAEKNASAPAKQSTKKIVVQLLNTGGADLHSYQPTIADMVKIANCDLLIYNGGASQFWVADALQAYPDPHRQVLSMMELFETQPERFPTYTQDGEHDHDQEHGHSHEQEHSQQASAQTDDHQDHEEEIDEHLWLSLKMTKEFCRAIASQLETLDPAAAAAYQANAAAYIQKLDALDRKFTDLTQQAKNKTLIFADRYPFKYFCDDYGLAHEAAFPGCSAETEASFETIISLADDLKALPASRLAILDCGSPALADTIIRAADLPETQIETLYSMQSLPQVTRALKQAGKIQSESEITYLYLMEQNYDALARLLDRTEKGQ